MIRGIIIAALSLGIIGTAFWGYQEHREKNAILINAENTYQRAFHDLSYQMNVLHDKIGTTLAMNSRKSLSPALADVWRVTSEAQSNVGQLPLTLLPFNKTEEFLSKIGNFSYRTAVRDLEKDPLSKDEYKTLTNLYKQSADLQSDLREVQHMVLKNNLRWMDVEMALATGNEAKDNTIIDGFKTVEKTVESYDESNMNDPTFSNFKERDKNFEHVTGKDITEEEAADIAKQYVKRDVNDIKVTSNGKGAKYGFYSVALVDRNGNESNLELTKKGGHPIWFIDQRDVSESKISLNDAVNKAERFLKDNKFKDMELSESVQYDHTGLLTFVTTQDNIRIYPEAIKIKVALDNGQIVGFAAADFLQTHQKRDITNPGISREEAAGFLNTNLKVMEDGLAIVTNDLEEDVLCYEFLGTLGNDTYRIFINAEDGMEEKVEKMQNAEPIYEDIV
ncbi:germination protein YpeB [Bacillus chungangensis]|uniref:Spore germination protein n=1 Tax=Bacillus chungangensis TaxID=587633 RepID=A0ABT9WYU6_9BACI|nr:germination protein YpeB [Bacillus chungangensis]MDQ0178392.1 spore germination protein [Bacillus chungangensis]